MKIDMVYIKSYTLKRGPVAGLCSLLALSLIGCDGGLIGTGSGPSDSVYELENLPNRISPDIPKTLLKGEESPPIANSNNKKKSDASLRSQESGSDKSTGWRQLSSDLRSWSNLRLGIEINATIVDLAFDDILNECAEQLLDCTIPADQIRVTLTQDVINRLTNLATEWVERTPSIFFDSNSDVNIIEKINAYIESLLDVEIVLGETHYAKLNGAPYDHDISTFLKWGPIPDDDDLRIITWCCLSDVDFSASWHEDGQVAQFTSINIDKVTHDYFYQNNVPGELVITHRAGEHSDKSSHDFNAKILSSDPDQAGILVETAGANTFRASEPSVGDAFSNLVLHQGYNVLQGQLDNSGGYTTYDSRYLIESHTIDSFEDINYSYRESFDQIGRLLAGERCNINDYDQTMAVCDDNAFDSIGPEGSSIIDSVHYLSPGEFDSLVAMQDAIRWTVDGLPSDVRGIAVISAESQSALSEAEVLCRGIQGDTQELHLFCMTTDEQLDNTIVVELDKGKLTRVIPEAKLVQIQ